MTLAPIAIFAFNRPDHLRRTLDALAANDLAVQSSLTFFCDGPRTDAEAEKTDAVRSLAHEEVSKGRFAKARVVERSENMGCANAVIAGLSEMFSEHERLIVVEDDILCSPHTLKYFNAGLEKYENYKSVWNISGWSLPPAVFALPKDYPYDVYAIPRFNCWGWASWRDRFLLIDWDMPDYETFAATPALTHAFNKGGDDMVSLLEAQMCGIVNSWAIRMDYARFKHGCVGINPVRSYTTNIGMGTGTHTIRASSYYDNDIEQAPPVTSDFRWAEHVFEDAQLCCAYRKGIVDRGPLWKHYLREGLSRLGLLGVAASMVRRGRALL